MSRVPTPAEVFDHGDYRRYWRGCRCPECTTAASKRSNRNQLLRQRGHGSICSSQAASRRIRDLQAAGMTNKAIQDIAQISQCTLYRVLRGEAIRRESLTRIMAVAVPKGTRVGTKALRPPTGTRRRMQALVAAGWPSSALAERLGLDRQFTHQLLYREHENVALQTELAVKALFGQIHTVRPETAGIHPTLAKRARLLAERRGWHPAGVWDDMDDPAAEPQYGESTRRELAIVEDVAELARQGYSREAIAERLDVTWDYVSRAFSRQRIPVPQIAA
nr:hypothetical protein KPHV_60310 [Kitasatospora purpeofusca]